MEKLYTDFLYLTYCGINGVKPNEEKVRKMDLDKLFKFAGWHSMTVIIYMALENISFVKTEKIDLMSEWKEAKEKAIRKNLMLDIERKKLFSYLEENKVWYMPLKGIILKDIYLKMGMRQMSDNDILFDADFEELVHKFFVSHGYRIISYKKHYHNIYKKEPVYNFEMHTELTGKNLKDLYKQYYSDVKERLIKSNKSEYGYNFSLEDFYIYMVVHTYKHFKENGTGVRSLTDVFVYKQKYDEVMDKSYLSKELRKIELYDFEKDFYELSVKLFSNAIVYNEDKLKLSDKENYFLNRCLTSGTYGTKEGFIYGKMEELKNKEGKVTKVKKIKYLFRRIFPTFEWMKQYYSICRKYPILIPVCGVYRIVVLGVKKSKKLLEELKIVVKS